MRKRFRLETPHVRWNDDTSSHRAAHILWYGHGQIPDGFENRAEPTDRTAQVTNTVPVTYYTADGSATAFV